MDNAKQKLQDFVDSALQLWNDAVLRIQAHAWTDLEIILLLLLGGLTVLYLLRLPSRWARKRSERRAFDDLKASVADLSQKLEDRKTSDQAVLELLGLTLKPLAENPGAELAASVRLAVAEQAGALTRKILAQSGPLYNEFEQAVYTHVRNKTVPKVAGEQSFQEEAHKIVAREAIKHVTELLAREKGTTRDIFEEAVYTHVREQSVVRVVQSQEFGDAARQAVLDEALRYIRVLIQDRRNEGQTWKALAGQVEQGLISIGREVQQEVSLRARK